MENILLSKNEVKELFKEILKEYDIEKQLNDSKNKLLSLNQVCKEICIGYEKLYKLIEKGLIKTTPDGKYITQFELNKYLGNE